jgi:hypothetical protein
MLQHDISLTREGNNGGLQIRARADHVLFPETLDH